MTAPAKTAAALAATAGTATVLATVRVGWIDAADGVLLLASLGVLARSAMRLASDPTVARRRSR